MPWYDYSPAPPPRRGTPLVRVRLWHGSQRVQLVALVDSGADRSTMDASYAAILGLDRADAVTERFTVAGGGELECLSWPNAPLEIQFGNDRFPFTGVFADFPASSDAVNLLGREDFFERYIVQFWDAAEMMNIDTSPDYPQPPA